MDRNNQKKVLAGCCIIYSCLAVIIYAILRLLEIRATLESQGELLILRDIINYTVSPTVLFILIIAPLIGSTIIVYLTKELQIGISSIKYFFGPILIFNIGLILNSLFEFLFNRVTTGVGSLIQVMGVGMFGFVLFAVLVSRSISLSLSTRLLRTKYPMIN